MPASKNQIRDKRNKELVAMTMLKEGASYRTIVNQTGLSNTTIKKLKDDMSAGKEVDSLDVVAVNKEITAKLQSKLGMMLEHVTEEKVKEAKLKDLMTSVAIAFDKMRLATGQATANHAHAHTITRLVQTTDKRLSDLESDPLMLQDTENQELVIKDTEAVQQIDSKDEKV